MGKDKLRRFAEFREFTNTFDFPYELKGKWHQEVFHNENPLVLELGCGKGEYTVALGRLYPEMNFTGVDIKSNRMWKGAGIAQSEGLKNVAFMRTVIHKLDELFAPAEVSSIWITFPDPFPKERHAKHRLTHPRFLDLYKKVLKPGGVIHFKTDDTDLFRFTTELFAASGIRPEVEDWDVHANPAAADHLKTVTTYYEKLFMGRGRTIKYARFNLTDYNAEAGWKYADERLAASKAEARQLAST